MNKMQDIPYLKFLPILIISIICYKLVDRFDLLYGVVQFTLNLFMPFIWALVIAYLLNPLMRLLEQRFKMKRVFSIMIVYLVLLGLLVAGVTVIVPRLFESAAEIILEVPSYFDQTKDWLNSKADDIKAVDNLLQQFNINLNELSIEDFQTQIQSVSTTFETFFYGFIATLFNFTSGLFKFLIGIVVSIYILKDKEALRIRTKEFMLAYLGVNKANKLFRISRDIDNVFSKYLIGKLIDSLIIGLICLVGLMLLGVKFSLLLAIIVGVTNMIPYFGPFIGAVPAIIITIFYSPIKALWVALFILALQQFDGYLLGPKILGDSVGLSPLWIILAIIVGGGLFGVVGMLIAVPVMAVIRNMSVAVVKRKLKEKDIVVND